MLPEGRCIDVGKSFKYLKETEKIVMLDNRENK